MAVAIVMPTAGARAIALTALLFAPIGVVAPKGLVLLLFAVGLWLLFRALGQGRLVPVFTGATAMLFGLFTTWALVSAAWSLDAGASVITTAKLAAVLLAALLVLDAVRQLPDRDAAAVGGALVIGYAVAALLLAAESLSGGLAHQALYRLQERSHEFDMSILNRAGAMLLLAAWPVALELRRRAGPGLAILAIVVAMAIALGGVGNSNQVAVLAAASAAIAAWWLGRRLCTSLAVLLVILIVAAPLLPRTLLAPERFQSMLDDRYYSALHRLEIWRFSALKIAEKPMLGWGMDAARRMPDGDTKLRHGGHLMNVHPHNATLQVWLELGGVGAGLLALLVAGLWLRAGRLGDVWRSAAAAGCLAAGLAVANLSFGVWQTWWMAALALAGGLFAAVVRPRG
ncbi:MAG: hypothetical protein QF578_08650 [Alphaproteobacteria bacterium]|nr:hypothetical protein [Alphaproteobacteria bacterium]MDP6564880.1 hypothetical protein [Alphaproteobacteria bacterium]MDP6811880.1 hypothetical protein [Alphaproteobacteria bacterium]